MPIRTVLISGASVAGPALAFWLRQYGIQATLVERAPGIREAGQSVDIRGAGREVVRRMGVEQAIRDATTGDKGILFVDDAGKSKAAIAAEAFGGEGFVAELEILRGDLAQVLYDTIRHDCETLFDNAITALHEESDHVRVTFAHGPQRSFDCVIGADGMRSNTRALLFGETHVVRSLGLCTAYFTIARTEGDGDWSRWYNAPRGRAILLRPDNRGTTRASMSFLSPPDGLERLDREAGQNLLQRVFADVGWEAPRILAAMPAAPDFYFECTGQVRQSSWSRGRVGLVGDAAYCASPVSGMGTSLALVGAYVLAGELARHHDPVQAFVSYQQIMRPYVAQAQDLPPGVPWIAHPRTRLGIRVMHGVLRTATAPGVRTLLGRLIKPPADAITLPDYGDRLVLQHGAAQC